MEQWLRNDKVYQDICIKNYKEYLIVDSQITKLLSIIKPTEDASSENKDYYDLFSELSQLLDKQEEIAVVIIVFAALSLEGLINHIGILGLGKSHYEKYLDKLSMCSKWVVIPKLVFGCELQTNVESFQLLTKLEKKRNGLVHFKSRKITNDSVKPIQQESLDLTNDVKDAVKSIISVQSDFDKLQIQKNNQLIYFRYSYLLEDEDISSLFKKKKDVQDQ